MRYLKIGSIFLATFFMVGCGVAVKDLGSGNYYLQTSVSNSNDPMLARKYAALNGSEAANEFCRSQNKQAVVSSSSIDGNYGRTAFYEVNFSCKDAATVASDQVKAAAIQAKAQEDRNNLEEKLKTPIRPLKAIFGCAEDKPRLANFKATKILQAYIDEGPQAALAMSRVYNCTQQDVDLSAPAVLNSANLMGIRTRTPVGAYYLIDLNSRVSVGAMGRLE